VVSEKSLINCRLADIWTLSRKMTSFYFPENVFVYTGKNRKFRNRNIKDYLEIIKTFSDNQSRGGSRIFVRQKVDLDSRRNN